LEVVGGGIFNITTNFAGFANTPSLQTICPSGFPNGTQKYTFSSLRKYVAVSSDQTSTILGLCTPLIGYA